MSKPRPWATLLIAAGVGGLVWALSPWLSGHHEPWDAEGFYYAAALAVAGAVSGLVSPRPIWAQYLGAVLGQAAFELIFLPGGPLFLLGVAFMLGYSLIFVVTAALAGYLRLRFLRSQVSSRQE